jgi:hypothetical protein
LWLALGPDLTQTRIGAEMSYRLMHGFTLERDTHFVAGQFIFPRSIKQPRVKSAGNLFPMYHCLTSTMRQWHLLCTTSRGNAMRRDFAILGGASAVLGLLTWALWGNPENPLPRMHTGQAISADHNLKLISERSPYMRTER